MVKQSCLHPRTAKVGEPPAIKQGLPESSAESVFDVINELPDHQFPLVVFLTKRGKYEKTTFNFADHFNGMFQIIYGSRSAR